MSLIKYSVIIPTLNEEKLLSILLSQLTGDELKKNYNFEIIVSDGGSTDKTLETAKKFADKVIEHRSPVRQTIALGRNAGAKAAIGEILIFLDSDILIDNPKKFFQVIEEDFVNSKYVAMTCKVNINPGEETLGDKLFHIFYNYYFCSLNILGMGMARGECQIIRKDIFNSVGGNIETLTAGEDFELFTRIRRLGKVLFTSKFCIYESPRRYRKFGYWDVTFSWLKNSVSVYLRKRSISKDWEEVR